MVSYVWEPPFAVSLLLEIHNLKFLFWALRHPILMKPNYFLNIFSHERLCLFFWHVGRLGPWTSGREHLDHIVQVNQSFQCFKERTWSLLFQKGPTKVGPWAANGTVQSGCPFFCTKHLSSPLFPMVTSCQFEKTWPIPRQTNSLKHKPAVKCY